MKLKCFVASAFGYKDVDLIYSKAILPVLKSINAEVFRVDKVEHNDDIDNKIIELIANCDVCIADLTYSRPSVYFEAGYALGLEKKVIYICRNDHFEKKEEDKHGNFCVHFDLKMKNIIAWSKPDKVFLSRLKRRLRYVMSALIAKQKRIATQESHAIKFQQMSLASKLQAISKLPRKLVRNNDLVEYKSSVNPNPERIFSRSVAIGYQSHYCKMISQSEELNIHLFAFNGFSQARLKEVVSFNAARPAGRGKPKILNEIYFICSTTQISKSVAERSLASYGKLNECIYFHSFKHKFYGYLLRQYYVLVGNIESSAEYSCQVSEAFDLVNTHLNAM